MQTAASQPKWNFQPLSNFRFPLITRRHEEWPRVDVCEVQDADQRSVCTVYNNNSAAIATFIADALTAFASSADTSEAPAAAPEQAAA